MKSPTNNGILQFMVCSCFLFFLNIKPAGAQKNAPMQELLQEFFAGETVYAQQKKEIQITSCSAFWKSNSVQTVNIPLQFEYGITNRLQFETGITYNFYSIPGPFRHNGMGGTEIGLLYNVLNNQNSLAISLAFDCLLLAQQNVKEFEESEVEWEPSLIIAKQFGKMQLHASFAADITKSDRLFNYNLASVFPFADWRGTLELNWQNNGKEMYITPGLIWKGLDDFEFGIGAPKNITRSRNEWGAILMITHEFSLIHKAKQ